MPVNAVETALARLVFQNNYELSRAVVLTLFNNIEKGTQTFTADELMAVMVQAAVDYQIEQNAKDQQNNSHYVQSDFLDTATPIDLLAAPPVLVTHSFEPEFNVAVGQDWI